MSRKPKPTTHGYAKASSRSAKPGPWNQRNVGSAGPFTAIAMSSTGTIIAVAVDNGPIYVSRNRGVTWVAGDTTKKWNSVAMSANGSSMLASWDGDGATQGSAGVATSTNGTNWTPATLPGGKGLTGSGAVAISGDGATMVYTDASYNQVFANYSGSGFVVVPTANPPPPLDGPANHIAVARNVQVMAATWGGGQSFLYSGADGMYGSSDGQTWTKTQNSVAAMSLAWTGDGTTGVGGVSKGVWIAIGYTGAWTSDDGAQTWTNVTLPSDLYGVLGSSGGAGKACQVAAMTPVPASGQPQKGVFAVWGYDSTADNQFVYTSTDFGFTWQKALTVPTTVGPGGPGSGQELVNAIVGAGKNFFLLSQYQATQYDGSSGRVYVSSDGSSFGSPTDSFGPASVWDGSFPQTDPYLEYSAGGVGYDDSAKKFYLVGVLDVGHIVAGNRDMSAIFSVSNNAAFGQSQGSSFYSAHDGDPGAGTSLSNFGPLLLGAAAGNGNCATAVIVLNSVNGTPSGYAVFGAFTGGGNSSLYTTGYGSLSVSNVVAAFNGSAFALVSYIVDATAGSVQGGGVYSAKPGQSWSKTHSGAPVIGAHGAWSNLSAPLCGAGLAVGNVAVVTPS